MSTDEKIGSECFGGTDYPDLPPERDVRVTWPKAEANVEDRFLEMGPDPSTYKCPDACDGKGSIGRDGPTPRAMPSAHRIVLAPYGAKIRSLLGSWLDGPPDASLATGDRRDWYTRRRDDALALLPDAANRERALLLAIVNHADAVRSGRA